MKDFKGMELHLAPLENVSCWAFRSTCRGATDTYTGMLSLSNLVKRNNVWKEVDTFPIPSQRQWIQIATSKETECAEFIRRLHEEIKNYPEKDNVYGIQLNASCPSPGLIRIGQGPALIKRSTKVSNLIRELLKQEKFKVGIKMRLGLNQFEVQQRKILALFEQLATIKHPNFTNVTVHFKHAADRSSTPYDYSLLKELVKFDLPLIINGGIKKGADFLQITKGLADKRIVGFMIGRAAMQDLDTLAKISNELYGTPFVSRTVAEIKKEFDGFCKVHEPKPLYLENIKKGCSWAKEQ